MAEADGDLRRASELEPIPKISSSGIRRNVVTRVPRSNQGNTSEINPSQSPSPSKMVRRPKTPSMPKLQEDEKIKGTFATAAERRGVMAEFAKIDEELPELVIDQISFDVFGYEQIKKESEGVEITSEVDAGRGTVNDPALGTIDSRYLCQTCGKDNINCPGHYGYIDIKNVGAYHPFFNTIQNSIIVQVLNSVCNSCGGLLLSKETIKHQGFDSFTGPERLKMIANSSIDKECRHEHTEGTALSPTTARDIGMSPTSASAQGEIKACKKNPKYIVPKLSTDVFIKYKYKDEDSPSPEILWPINNPDNSDRLTAFKILNAISDEDARILGFGDNTHPRDLIIRALIVMPPSIRSASLREGMIGRDGYGDLYKKIIKSYKSHNKIMVGDNIGRKRINNEDALRMKKIELRTSIQRAIIALMTPYNHSELHISESFKPIKSRINDKKNGIIRGIFLGKRVNYSARSVAGPGPSLKFYQVGLPEEFRKSFTQQVVVTNDNYEALRDLMKNGNIVYITPSTGKSKDQQIRVSARNREKISFNFGDKVTRYGQDGDIVVVNRQPTIQKQGMMGFEAVYLPGKTIRISLSATKPLNADFDGDELNVHAPQTIEALLDVLGHLDIRRQIINPQDNRPIIVPVMDSLSSAYSLTQDNVYVDGDIWNNSMMNIEATDGLPTLEKRLTDHGIFPTRDPSTDYTDIIPAERQKRSMYSEKGLNQLTKRKNIYDELKYSGRALFSMLLPPDFFYDEIHDLEFDYHHDDDNDDIKDTKKQNVVIIDGILVNGVITGKVIGSAHNSIVQKLYKNYPDNRVVEFISDASRLLETWLTSVGFSIGLDDCDILNATNKKEIQSKINMIIAQVKQLGPTLRDPLEDFHRRNEIVAKVGQLRNLGATLSEKMMRPDNALNVMTLSGAKGSTWNTAQIAGAVGQQFIRGGLAPLELTGDTRSIAYFRPHDTDPRARGLIVNSFTEGLRPSEVFFHQAAGREGIIDTANKTAEVGALRRDISKLLEDIKIGKDGSSVGIGGKLIQPVYGDDGFDGKDLENVKHGDYKVPSFADLKDIAGRLNVKFGYYPKGYKPKNIIPRNESE